MRSERMHRRSVFVVVFDPTAKGDEAALRTAGRDGGGLSSFRRPPSQNAALRRKLIEGESIE